eukprot:COSAG03_NODE_91_length_13404_cov_69.155205_10_plen_259_part_00
MPFSSAPHGATAPLPPAGQGSPRVGAGSCGGVSDSCAAGASDGDVGPDETPDQLQHGWVAGQPVKGIRRVHGYAAVPATVLPHAAAVAALPEQSKMLRVQPLLLQNCVAHRTSFRARQHRRHDTEASVLKVSDQLVLKRPIHSVRRRRARSGGARASLAAAQVRVRSGVSRPCHWHTGSAGVQVPHSTRANEGLRACRWPTAGRAVCHRQVGPYKWHDDMIPAHEEDIYCTRRQCGHAPTRHADTGQGAPSARAPAAT